MKIKKGCGKGVNIPQDDFGMWISDQIKKQDAEKEKRLKQITKATTSKEKKK